jgi:hypothetical protein
MTTVATSGIKGLVGQRMTKEVKFMGSSLKISKLSVDEVVNIQAQAKDAETNEMAGLELLKTVIRAGSEGGADLTDEDFGTFAMDELSKLSGEIMKFSGMGADAGK